MRKKFRIEGDEGGFVIEVVGDGKIRCYMMALLWANREYKSYRAIIPVEEGEAGYIVVDEPL
jgi:hypothetical protein